MAFESRKPFRHAVGWGYVATLSQRGIRMVVLLVLAAILAPHDFGAVAMAMAYILFIEMFVAQGVTPAIVQKKVLTSEQLDSVFWLVFGSSIVLAVVSLFVAPWWAGVNNLPELQPILMVLAVSIPIKGLTVVQRAVLQRQMVYRKLAMLDAIASIVAGAVSIGLVLGGAGVWALVVQQLLSTALAVVLMWKVSEWHPRLRYRWAEARSIFSFSGGVFASEIGAYLSTLADIAIMGIFFGPVAVGLYRIAGRLVEVILEVGAKSVQVPSLRHFADLQGDPPRLRRAVLGCVRVISMVTIPGFALVFATRNELTAFLGDQWTPAADALGVLAMLGVVRVLTLVAQPLLLAQGRTRTVAVLVWSLGVATVAGVGVVAMMFQGAVVGQQVLAVSVARLVVYVLVFGVAGTVAIVSCGGLRPGDLIEAVTPGLAAGVVGVVVVTLVQSGSILGNAPGFVELVVLSAAGGVSSLLTILVLDRQLRGWIQGLPGRVGQLARPGGATTTEGTASRV